MNRDLVWFRPEGGAVEHVAQRRLQDPFPLSLVEQGRQGRDEWVAQLSLSGAALKCGVRDRWIGWDFRSQYGRLTLIANNSRFLILPDWHRPNLGSRVLSLTERRVVGDWQARFGHPVLLLETFVDPRHFYGGVYRAANWIELGLTQGAAACAV